MCALNFGKFMVINWWLDSSSSHVSYFYVRIYLHVNFFLSNRQKLYNEKKNTKKKTHTITHARVDDIGYECLRGLPLPDFGWSLKLLEWF